MPIISNNFITRIYRWIHIRIEVLIKSYSYKHDENYRSNNDVSRCFEDRLEKASDDAALLRRISTAYKKASRDLLDCTDIFKPSNEWLPIYKKNYNEVIQALTDSDTRELDKIYRNFWREPCSRGLVGLPVDMKKSFFGKNKKISYLNKTLFLNDSIHRFNLWRGLLGERYAVDSLISPIIGNPYGYYIQGKFIKSGADYQHYYATRIIELLDGVQGKKAVMEIGGGFGGMAYYLIRDARNTVYIDFDLPENLALTSYYLMKAFPEKKVLLYGEAALEAKNLAEYDIVLMPNFDLEKLRDGECDLIFNSYSLAEMSPQTINYYVSQSARIVRKGGWFFHVNHTKHSLVSAREFPVPDDLVLVNERLAAWNMGRNSNMDEYEFLYKKNN